MARALVSDALWAEIEPLLPEHEVSELGGRPRVPDRAALTGVLFVLKTGILNRPAPGRVRGPRRLLLLPGGLVGRDDARAVPAPDL